MITANIDTLKADLKEKKTALNGIKLIDCYGEKMPEETLLLVEDYLDGKLHVFDKDWPELPFSHREHIGCTVDYVAGRNRYILVRESGTEPVVRVMVEAPDHDTCQKYVSQVVETIKSRGYGV